MDSPPETRDRSAQVCDQCRKRKIKCDGILPACSNCAQSKTTCAFSVQLRRKTKRRGHDPKDQAIQDLQTEIAGLRQQLGAQTQAFQGQSPNADGASSLGNDSQPAPLSRYQSAAARRATIEASRQSEKAAPGPVFRHLGRLVCPEDGVDQFAGSSTGVHFTLSAQTKYQSLLSSNESFPEAVFSLYLLTRYPNKEEKAGSWRRSPKPTLQSIFSQPKSYYIGEIERFFETWSYLYPILARKQFFDGVHRIFDAANRRHDDLNASDETILYQLLIVLAIASCDNTNSDKTSKKYYSISLDLYHHITAIGNLASLQGLLLLLVYYQATAQHHLVYNTVGSVVRIAHSLGLHRHARRFRFCVGETEVRKRLWWCVYIFDVMTSLHYGLPKVINNEDDDNDLPADCDFEDITLTQLPLPLPGESTKMSPFLCYIKLTKILSAILKELYTTTRRRNGVQKIEQLTRELQVWESLSEPTIGRFSDIEHDYGHNGDGGGRDVMSLWLHLLGQMALIYIHRPALTFEPSEPQFKASLSDCSRASANIISLLHLFRGDEQLFRLFPSGPSLIFQCALLCLYQLWHNMPPTAPTSPVSYMQNEESHIRLHPAIEAGASLLDDLQQTGFFQSTSNNGFSSKPPPLTQASWVLRHLSTTTQHSQQTRHTESPRSTISTALNPLQNYPFAPQSNSSRSQQEGGLEQMHFTPESLRPSSSHEQNLQLSAGTGTELSPDFLFGNGNGLGYLNQMDDSTWTFLSQMGGYSGEVANAGFMDYS